MHNTADDFFNYDYFDVIRKPPALYSTAGFQRRRSIGGRIDNLFVRSPQQWVPKEQPLYSIYSEELLSYENEYLNALQQELQFSSMRPVVDQLVEGARKKLLLWGLLPSN